jgi:hypothetical protein
LLCLSSAVAQVSSGRMTGSVTDASGAAIAGATVTVINEGTGAQRVLQTAADGTYTAVALNPASYDVAVVKDGFARSEATNLTLGRRPDCCARLRPESLVDGNQDYRPGRRAGRA